MCQKIVRYLYSTVRYCIRMILFFYSTVWLCIRMLRSFDSTVWLCRRIVRFFNRNVRLYRRMVYFFNRNELLYRRIVYFFNRNELLYRRNLCLFLIIIFKLLKKARKDNQFNFLNFIFGFLITFVIYSAGLKGIIVLFRSFFSGSVNIHLILTGRFYPSKEMSKS